MRLQPVVLAGEVVLLEPLGYHHADQLAEAGAFDEIWTYLDRPTPRSVDAMAALIREALEEQERGQRIPFAIIDRASGTAVGSTSYLDIQPRNRTVEIGWTWLTPHVWGTGINTEAKFLLMRHAFEDHHAGRVALKTDLRNERSQRAIARLGAVREGVLRNHRLLSTGQYRHTVYFSVIDSEWPQVRERLRKLLRERHRRLSR